ncbi:MAG: cell wall hydrolase [Pseudoramibacter sp.]
MKHHFSKYKWGACLLAVLTMFVLIGTPVHADDVDLVALTDSINQLNTQIGQLGTQMNETNQELADKTAEYLQAKAELKAQRKTMAKRVRAMYMMGTDGYMQFLFGNDNISETFSNLDGMHSIVRSDNDRLNQYIQTAATAKAAKASVEKQQQALIKQQNDLNAKVAEEQKKLQEYAANHNTSDPGDQLDFICAVVAAECNSSYDGALAVISCVMNRVDSGKWGGTDAVSVLKAPGQFAAYLDGPYKKYLGGKYPDYVKQAVIDCMMGGKRSHPYQSFRSGSTYGVWNCGGNSYR